MVSWNTSEEKLEVVRFAAKFDGKRFRR